MIKKPKPYKQPKPAMPKPPKPESADAWGGEAPTLPGMAGGGYINVRGGGAAISGKKYKPDA